VDVRESSRADRNSQASRVPSLDRIGIRAPWARAPLVQSELKPSRKETRRVREREMNGTENGRKTMRTYYSGRFTLQTVKEFKSSSRPTQASKSGSRGEHSRKVPGYPGHERLTLSGQYDLLHGKREHPPGLIDIGGGSHASVADSVRLQTVLTSPAPGAGGHLVPPPLEKEDRRRGRLGW